MQSTKSMSEINSLVLYSDSNANQIFLTANPLKNSKEFA